MQELLPTTGIVDNLVLSIVALVIYRLSVTKKTRILRGEIRIYVDGWLLKVKNGTS